MSMNNANYLRSPCEVIREINDEFQGDTELDKKIRKLCAEAEDMTKRLSIELSKYNGMYYDGWWKSKPNYSELLAYRKSQDYKFDKV